MVVHLLDGFQRRTEVADILDPRFMTQRLGSPRLCLLYFGRFKRPENAKLAIPDAVVDVAVSAVAQHVVDVVHRHQNFAGPVASSVGVLRNNSDLYRGEQIAKI